MRLSVSFATWTVLTIAFTVGSAASALSAEERVVRVPPAGAVAAKPWPKCGSFADEKIRPNVAYEISSSDPDGKWTFDDVGFGRRSAREDPGNCIEAFVPTGQGCAGIKAFHKALLQADWVGVEATCAPGVSDANCSPGPVQPQAAGFVMHRAISPKGTDGCWIQMRNWQGPPSRTNAADFKFQWTP